MSAKQKPGPEFCGDNGRMNASGKLVTPVQGQGYVLISTAYLICWRKKSMYSKADNQSFLHTLHLSVLLPPPSSSSFSLFSETIIAHRQHHYSWSQKSYWSNNDRSPESSEASLSDLVKRIKLSDSGSFSLTFMARQQSGDGFHERRNKAHVSAAPKESADGARRLRAPPI